MRSLLFLLSFLPFFGLSQPFQSWDEEKIEVKKGTSQNTILSASVLYSEGWSELAQPKFWKQIMQLSPDSCLINVAATRNIVAKMSLKDWNAQSDNEKDQYRDSIRTMLSLDGEARIFVTTGKSDFYK